MRNNDPRIITAKFTSTCKETGDKIPRGEKCLYYPSSRKVFKIGTEQHKSYLDWKFDIEMLGQDY